MPCMKRRVRLSERKWRQNRTDNYRNCYFELRDQYCRTLASTKAAFYSKVILRSIINLSYESSTVTASMKHAVMTPLLKRSGLSADDYSSYRPFSNLPCASKLFERHVSAQLRLHLQSNDLEDPFQTAYRQAHSVETAIVCIQDDILRLTLSTMTYC